MSMSSTRTPTILWLRNDLRVDDHEPLDRALRFGDAVVPVFCVDPRQFAQLPSGVPKTGAFRARFLIEALADLRTTFRTMGGELIVRYGRPEAVLPAIAREVDARRVLMHEEVASEETAIEADVAAALDDIGVSLNGIWGHTLYHADDLPFDLASLPDVFTKFRNRVERESVVRPPRDAPRRMSTPAIEPGVLPDLQALGHKEIVDDARALFRPIGGETAARARLDHYLWETDGIRTYKDTRNGMLRVDDSSKLSPWLALGCLSPRRVFSEVQRYEHARVKNDSTYWLIFELLWRDYFRFIMAQSGDQLFAINGVQSLRFSWRSLRDASTREDFAQWTAGTTGFPIVDAAMRELSASGYTSNRARQNVASFLTKNLGIDWRLGAEWFESLLVDYDVASNWGNWAYAAGVGNDARGFRFFNVIKQSRDYDPSDEFARHWIPELREDSLAAYPAPMLDLFATAKANEARYQRAARVASVGARV